MRHTIGDAQGLISHALSVEEALGLAQLKAVEISTAQSGRWDELAEDAIRNQRCAAPRAFEQRLSILIKYLKSVSDEPSRVLRDVETEGLAMLAAAKICREPWIAGVSAPQRQSVRRTRLTAAPSRRN